MAQADLFKVSLPSFAALALTFLAACGGGGGTPAPVTPEVPVVTVPGAYADSVQYSNAPGAALASANEGAAVIASQITLAGKAFNYTATSGHLSATDVRTGRPSASFFYVAYTAGTPDSKRPLTFFYNGGPGSASLWLHLGSFGPKRIVTNIPSSTMPATTQLVDNQETLLAHSDLVFVDAIGTGYSQAIAPNANQDFWGVDRDAAAFRDFVQRYVSVNQRQASPKFLYGESYGAPRTAVLANLLETAGVQIDGLMLQSAILNYNSNCGVFDPGTVSCEGYVPTYAATGAYHQRAAPAPAPADFGSYVQQARAFGAGAYRSGIAAYLASKVAPPAAVTAQLLAYTGIAQASWTQNPDMGPDQFQRALLPGQLIGRYDARVSAPNGSALTVDNDPSLTLINAAFVNTIGSYVRDQLHYSARSNYTSYNDIINRWNFGHDGRALPDTIPDLSAALTQNPFMKILVLSGYHDLATPFYQTELDLARLGSAGSLQFRTYASGHMSYLDDAARRAQQADLITFYQSASAAH